MPTYLYRREDGTTFEIEQRITEPALDTCPTTGQPVKRVIAPGAGLVFKGSGFYLTDYARKPEGGDKKAASDGSDGDTSSKSDTSKGATAKEPASKTDAGSASTSSSTSSGSSSGHSSGSSGGD